MNDNLQALTDAIGIMDKAMKQAANGPMFPFQTLKHGRDYLNSQIAAYFAPQEIKEVTNGLGMVVCKHCLKSDGEHNIMDQCIDNRGNSLGTKWEPLTEAA